MHSSTQVHTPDALRINVHRNVKLQARETYGNICDQNISFKDLAEHIIDLTRQDAAVLHVG